MTEMHLAYVYAEFNPNWIMGGWHFYHVPVSETGEPRYDAPERCWLKAPWALRDLCELLQVPYCNTERTLVHSFYKQYPHGAFVLASQNGYRFALPTAEQTAHADIAQCALVVREGRENTWYTDDAEGQNLPAADLVKRLDDAVDTCRARGEAEAADTADEARRYIESLLRLARETRGVLTDWIIGDGDGNSDMDELTDKILPSVCDGLARALRQNGNVRDSEIGSENE